MKSLYQLLLTPLMIGFSLITVTSQSDSLSTARFDFEACDANFGRGEQFDYSEFTAQINNNGACADFEIVSGHLYNDNPEDNPHSCTYGINGGTAICISSQRSCIFNPASENALKFDVRMTPGPEGIAIFSDLSLYERAPEEYTWINTSGGPDVTGPNNYPQYFKVRILKNGEEIYVSPGTPTQLDWTEHAFDFSTRPEFMITEPTVFRIELFPYCTVGNGAVVSAWDVDELQVASNCCLILQGGDLEGGPFEFCVGDGEPDHVSGITLSGNVGSGAQYVVTDESGTILALPEVPDSVDFDGAGGGICLIWHVSYYGMQGGLEMGGNLFELPGECYALSDSVVVIRNEQPEGGTLSGGPFEFCVGDGIPDHVSGITLSGNTGDSSVYLITDTAGLILRLPPHPDSVDFDGAGAGICLIWSLSYDGSIEGLEEGNSVGDIMGCFGLSDSVVVVRNALPEPGELSGGPFTFCVGDGVADHVDGVTLSGNTGSGSQFVVTDTALNILSLPDAPEDVDFDDAGTGTCLIWHVSYEGDITGVEVGNNVADVTGCFTVSNSIEVVRNQPVGGELTGGPFEFCIDSIPDFVDSVELTGNIGESQWVVTDTAGMILSLPPAPDSVDFNEAGPGVCLIWHLSYIDSIGGAEVGNNASDLTGCFSLSNSITVTRLEQPCGDSLQTGGGPVLDMHAYPNPARDVITLELENSGIDPLEVQVFDVFGRLCLREKCFPMGDRRIDMSDLPDGQYFISVHGRTGQVTKSVVLLR